MSVDPTADARLAEDLAHVEKVLNLNWTLDDADDYESVKRICAAVRSLREERDARDAQQFNYGWTEGEKYGREVEGAARAEAEPARDEALANACKRTPSETELHPSEHHSPSSARESDDAANATLAQVKARGPCFQEDFDWLVQTSERLLIAASLGDRTESILRTQLAAAERTIADQRKAIERAWEEMNVAQRLDWLTRLTPEMAAMVDGFDEISGETKWAARAGGSPEEPT